MNNIETRKAPINIRALATQRDLTEHPAFYFATGFHVPHGNSVVVADRTGSHAPHGNFPLGYAASHKKSNQSSSLSVEFRDNESSSLSTMPESMKPVDKERFDIQFVFMLLYLPEVVGNLMPHPTFRASAKSNRQMKRHLR